VHSSPADPVAPPVLVASLDAKLAELLRAAGFRVAMASSISKLRDAAVRLSPSVVIVDDLLEDVTATDACRALRTDPTIPRNLPILVVVSGVASPALRVAAIRVGAWDFLDRAMPPNEIAQQVGAHVESRRSFGESADAEFHDMVSGLRTRLGLARRARELASLMTRMRSGLCSVVIEVESRAGITDLGRVVARAARLSDVVGEGGQARAGIIAPATDADGAIQLATRVANTVASVAHERGLAAESGSPAGLVAVGFDAVSNAAYAPFDPLVLLRNAANAVRYGELVDDRPWLRRHFAAQSEDPGAFTRQAPSRSPNDTPVSTWSSA
jgi:DNA-binding NtrC family response regulator